MVVDGLGSFVSGWEEDNGVVGWATGSGPCMFGAMGSEEDVEREGDGEIERNTCGVDELVGDRGELEGDDG